MQPVTLNAADVSHWVSRLWWPMLRVGGFVLAEIAVRTIGLDFGGRDYSTVIYSCKKIESDLQNDSALREKIATIEKKITTL